jgi:hypothetical protein
LPCVVLPTTKMACITEHSTTTNALRSRPLPAPLAVASALLFRGLEGRPLYRDLRGGADVPAKVPCQNDGSAFMTRTPAQGAVPGPWIRPWCPSGWLAAILTLCDPFYDLYLLRLVQQPPRGSGRKARLERRQERRQSSGFARFVAFATKIFDSNKRHCWLKRASLG